MPVPDEDDDRVAKNGFNYMVGQLQQVGQRIGAPPHPLTNQSVINATQAIVGAMGGAMGGGGGDYGIKCKATVPQVVQAAYDAGYHIDDDEVRDAIRGVATQLAAMGGTTQIGSYKGDSRGGGFFDYDKK